MSRRSAPQRPMSAGEGGRLNKAAAASKPSPCSAVASVVIRPVYPRWTADPSTFSIEEGNETDGFREAKSPLWSNIDIYFLTLRWEDGHLGPALICCFICVYANPLPWYLAQHVRITKGGRYWHMNNWWFVCIFPKSSNNDVLIFIRIFISYIFRDHNFSDHMMC